MVVALIALTISLSGVAWAVVRIDTEDLKPRVVTTKKLARAAVDAGKLASDSVTSRTIANLSVESDDLALIPNGAAIAGVEVGGPSPYTGSWFNRVGATPSVSHNTTGSWTIDVPGFKEGGDYPNVSTALAYATLEGGTGEIVARTGQASAGAPYFVVNTYDSTGTPADRNFTWIVYAGKSRVETSRGPG
jgi:hypothetical protein